jgi:hypothetical protein
LWRAFIHPPCTTRVDEGIRVRVTASARVPVHYLASSVVVVGVENRPPLGNLGCALRHRPTLVLRSHPGVAPWLPHRGLANGEGGHGHELVLPGAVLRQVCLLGGHLLAAGDAGLSDPGEHEALGEAVLGHARHVPCPEQRATREVVLEREDPGALLGALGGDAVDERLAHGDAAHLACCASCPAAAPTLP